MSRLEKSAMSQSTSTPVPYSLDRKVRAVLRPSKVPVLKAVDLERAGRVTGATGQTLIRKLSARFWGPRYFRGGPTFCGATLFLSAVRETQFHLMLRR
jgi:hypothetical protein